MNKERVLQLADLIETVEDFDMSDYTHGPASCGSPSCIAGWAAWEELNRPKGLRFDECESHATVYLELTDAQAHDLFCGSEPAAALRGITAVEAARVLRHLAETGEVRWALLTSYEPDYVQRTFKESGE